MLILAIGDLHGRYTFPREVKKELNCADLIVMNGDITDFGGESQVQTVLNEFRSFKDKLLAVSGNCDRNEVNQVLDDWGISLKNTGKIIQGVGFFGLAGSGLTPFNTPQEYPENELAQFLLTGWSQVKGAKTKILVSHSPPKGCKLDLTGSRLHAGSKAVRNFIEEHQPHLVLCGHIHEAKGYDKIGSTLVINPGPFPYSYAWVEINETINFRFSGRL